MQDVTGHVTGLALTAVNKVLPKINFFLQHVVNFIAVLVLKKKLKLNLSFVPAGVLTQNYGPEGLQSIF